MPQPKSVRNVIKLCEMYPRKMEPSILKPLSKQYSIKLKY